MGQSDFILSNIIPPTDSYTTAGQIITVLKGLETPLKKMSYCADLNAVSPASAAHRVEGFASTPIRFIDGGIIDAAQMVRANDSWTKPSLVVSGPHTLEEVPASGRHVAETLNIKHIAGTIGQASGLKMSLASTTKGLAALSIQSFATAHKLGVLDQLQLHLTEYSLKTCELKAKGLVGMPPKAYMWVNEMKEIAETSHDDGGFEKGMFEDVSEIYQIVAWETGLGREETEERILGKTPEDNARVTG